MKRILEMFVRIELLAGQIYTEFAASDKSDDELKKIWLKMARDEQDHANALKLALRLPSDEFMPYVHKDCPDPEASIRTLSTILGRAKTHSDTKVQMLADAVMIEKTFRVVHATYSLSFKGQSLQQTFARLSRSDEEHVAELKKYIEHYKQEHKK